MTVYVHAPALLVLPGVYPPDRLTTGDLSKCAGHGGQRWYPLGPLMSAAGITSMAELRLVCPMGGVQYRQAIDRGLTELQADRWAVKLGLLPWMVWPAWLDDALTPCEAPGCDRRFAPHPRAPHTRYCSSTCRQRAKARRYRATANGADANRRHRRAYYEANRGYELERKRIERQRAAERRDAA